MFRNSTHTVLSDTQQGKGSESKIIDKESTVAKQSSAQEDAPYTKSFVINQDAFKEEESIYHDLEAREDSAELLRWHQQFNHFSFRGLKLLAKLNLLP